jgi:hypothetical protein
VAAYSNVHPFGRLVLLAGFEEGHETTFQRKAKARVPAATMNKKAARQRAQTKGNDDDASCWIPNNISIAASDDSRRAGRGQSAMLNQTVIAHATMSRQRGPSDRRAWRLEGRAQLRLP